MATIYKCDRCAHEETTRLVSFNMPLRNYYGDYDNDNTTKIDLCNSCIRQLEEFVKPLPKQG